MLNLRVFINTSLHVFCSFIMSTFRICVAVMLLTSNKSCQFDYAFAANAAIRQMAGATGPRKLLKVLNTLVC